MHGLFSMDGPIYKYGGLLADLLLLTLLWLLCSLPIITIGAATTAVYYVTTRRLSDKESYITRDFFLSFNIVMAIVTAVIAAARPIAACAHNGVLVPSSVNCA